MNNNLKILFLMGIPCSGKSTYANQLCLRKDTSWTRINKDDLRAMLFNNKPYSKGIEVFS
jgi:predicted kinase